MSLRSMLGRLEQLAAAPMLAPRCEGCGFPSRSSGGVLVVFDESAEPEHCAVCGSVLDELGRALAGVSANGDVSAGVIVHGVESPA